MFVASEVGLQYADPYSLVFLRFVAASAVVIPLALLFRKALNLGSELRSSSIWLLGAIYALGFLLQYLGQDLTNASHATLLSNLAPTLVPIAAFTMLKEAITKGQKAATALGLSGLFFIAAPKLSLGSGNTLGDLLLFGTSVSYTLFIILSKRLNGGSVGSSFAIVISVTVFLMPAAVLLGGLDPSILSIGPLGWASIIYMGVAGSVIAIALYLKGLSSITSSESATLLLLQVLTGLVLATLIFREFLSSSEIAGAASILAGVALASLTTRLRRHRDRPLTKPVRIY